MQSIQFHIAYLLTRHECVIVPGLGAFIVSLPERGKNSRWGILSPPETFLGFNSEIKHNDGLLANSLAKERKCSYKEANLLIEQYVANALQSLSEGKRVCIPWVGSILSTDNRKLFQPERILSCNAFCYGLSDFSLSSVEELQQEQEPNAFPRKKNKEVVWIPVNRRLITYSGSVAAAILAMCIIPTPLNNGGHSNQEIRAQYASLINLPAKDEVNTVEEKDTLKAAEIPAPVKLASAQKKTDAQPPETVSPAEKDGFHYYIIVASLPNESSAEKTLSEFQSKGFANAAVLSADGKHRIYTNHFDDKAEADKFLIQFRKDHPENAAWLLKKN